MKVESSDKCDENQQRTSEKGRPLILESSKNRFIFVRGFQYENISFLFIL